MAIKASHTTAAIAGAWTVLGLVPFEIWIDQHKEGLVLSNNLLWLLALAVFLFVPGYYLVLGKDTEAFSQLWFADREERARYFVIVKRMFIWFVSAGAIGSIWSLTLSFISSKL